MVDIFQHEPALRLAWDLEDRGIHLAADGNELVLSPRGLLTAADLEACRRYKPALLLIAKICDPEVQRRRERFVSQQPSTVGIVDPGWRYVRGVCFSCGAPVPTWGRCWRCQLAWCLTWRLPITVEEEDLSCPVVTRPGTGPVTCTSTSTDPVLSVIGSVSKSEPEP